MSSKAFNIVAAATIILAVWAVWLAAQSKFVVIKFVRGQRLVEQIDTSRLTKIEIKKGDENVVLEKRGDKFLVVSRDSYPADGGRINNLIQQITGITCGREIATTTDVHAELGVDTKSKDAVVIRFLAGAAEIVGVIIGKQEGSADYVRLSNNDKVYISEHSVFPDTDALAYVDKDLIGVVNIEKVEVSGGKKPYSMLKVGDAGVVQGVPEGMVPKTPDNDNVFTACRSISFRDFRSEANLDGVEFDHKYVVTTESKERYTLTVGKKGDEWWVKGAAKYVGPATLTPEEVEKSKKDPALLKKQEALLQADQKVRAFAGRHLSWVYKISDMNAKLLTKEFADLIEEDKQFLRIKDDSITSVSVATADGSYTLVSPKSGVIEMKDLPKGKEVRPFVPNGVFSASTGLSWMERIDPAEALVKDVKFDTKYDAVLKNKANYTFEVGKKDSRFFVRASAAFVGGPKDDSPESVIARGAVAKFNKVHKGSVYEVAAGGAVDNLMTPRKDLLKDAAELPAEIAASHILITYKGSERSTTKRSKEEAEKKAKELLAKVKADPSTFAKVAEENSDGPTKTKGGDLGRFDQETMAPPFTAAAFKLKVGQISDVVETKFGFHIILRTQ